MNESCNWVDLLHAVSVFLRCDQDFKLCQFIRVVSEEAAGALGSVVSCQFSPSRRLAPAYLRSSAAHAISTLSVHFMSASSELNHSVLLVVGHFVHLHSSPGQNDSYSSCLRGASSWPIMYLMTSNVTELGNKAATKVPTIHAPYTVTVLRIYSDRRRHFRFHFHFHQTCL